MEFSTAPRLAWRCSRLAQNHRQVDFHRDFDKHRRGARRDRECASGFVELRVANHRIGRIGLYRMQLQLAVDQPSGGKGRWFVAGIEQRHNPVVLRIKAVGRAVSQLHHDQAGRLARASVQEAQMRLNLGGGFQPKQLGTFANVQHFLEVINTTQDVGLGWFECRITQQLFHQRPVRLIFGGRQANAPVVGVERPIEFVEPVAGIVSVAPPA